MHAMSVCMKGQCEYTCEGSDSLQNSVHYTLSTLEIRIRMVSPCKYLGASEL